MKFIIFIITLFFGVLVQAELISEQFLSQKEKIAPDDFFGLANFQEQFISEFEHLGKKCGSEKEYYDLVTLGYLIEGTHLLEYYSEIASKAIMKCPKEVINTLKRHHAEPVANFVNSLGIRIPPWEVAEAIYQEVSRKENTNIYNQYFKKWFNACVTSNGKAIVGCGANQP